MLTQEQIKNLKPGDPVIIEATFYRLDYDGDVIGETTWTTRGVSEKCKIIAAPSCVSLPSEHGTSVPTPKHDPCRPFKAGDVARVVERFGRIDATHTLGALVTVTKDECGFTFVHVKHETGAEGLIPWLYLELVTPVEELEPYKLIDFPNTYNIVRDSAMVMTIHKKSHPNAKAAAEAECDRLNAEWRKNQNND